MDETHTQCGRLRIQALWKAVKEITMYLYFTDFASYYESFSITSGTALEGMPVDSKEAFTGVVISTI